MGFGSGRVREGGLRLRRAAFVAGLAGLAVGIGHREARAGGVERVWTSPLCLTFNLNLNVPTNWDPAGSLSPQDTVVFLGGQGCSAPFFITYGGVASLDQLRVIGTKTIRVDLTLACASSLFLSRQFEPGLLVLGDDSQPGTRLLVGGEDNAITAIWAQIGSDGFQRASVQVGSDASLAAGRLDLNRDSTLVVEGSGTLFSGFEGDLGGFPVVLNTAISGSLTVEPGGQWSASTNVVMPPALSGISFGEIVVEGIAGVQGELQVPGGAVVSVSNFGELEVGSLEIGEQGVPVEARLNISGIGSVVTSGQEEPGVTEDRVGEFGRVEVTDSGWWNAMSHVRVTGPGSVSVDEGAFWSTACDVVIDSTQDDATVVTMRGLFDIGTEEGVGQEPGLLTVNRGIFQLIGSSAIGEVTRLDVGMESGQRARVWQFGESSLRVNSIDPEAVTIGPEAELGQFGGMLFVDGGVRVDRGLLNVQNGLWARIHGGLEVSGASVQVIDNVVAETVTFGAIAPTGLSVLGDARFNMGSIVTAGGPNIITGGATVLLEEAAFWGSNGALTINQSSTVEIFSSGYGSGEWPVAVSGGASLRIGGSSLVTSAGLNVMGPLGGPLVTRVIVNEGATYQTNNGGAPLSLLFNSELLIESGGRCVASNVMLLRSATLEADGALIVEGLMLVEDTAVFNTAADMIIGGEFALGDGVRVSDELRLVNVFDSPGFDITVGGPGGLTIAPGGVVRLMGYSGQQNIINAPQSITLGGTLIVEASPGLNPAAGESFVLFNSEALQGRFSLHVLPGFSDDRAYEVNYTTPAGLGPAEGAVELTVTTVGALLGLQPGPATAVAGLPSSAAVGDLNGDGFDDLVVAVPDVNPNLPGKVVVLINNGVSGGIWQGFSSGTQITVGANPRAVALGNFDNDAVGPGKSNLDIAVAHGTDNNIRIYANDGDGVMFAEAAGSPIAVGNNPSDLVAADFNSDGRPDLAVSNEDDGTVLVLLNTGAVVETAVSFSVGSVIVVGDMPVDIDTTDVDNDKDIDIVVANFGSSNAVVSGNDGGGVFGAPSTAPTGSGPVSVSTGDLSGNGLPDAVTANINAGTVTVLSNTGGVLTPIGDIPVGEEPRSVALVDLDGDGLRDITVVVNDPNGGRTIQLIRNLTTSGGVPTFAGITDLSTGASPIFILTGDINADGRPDLISIDEIPVAGLLAGPESGATPTSDGSVTVFLNFTAPLPACAGDANGDSKVDGMDLSAVLAKFGQAMPPMTGPNLNGDSVVDGSDLSIVLSAFGNACGK